MSSTQGFVKFPGRRVSQSGQHLLAEMAVMVGCLVVAAGCAFKAPPGRASGEMSAVVVDHQPYRIRVGDELDVRFYKTPELNVEKVPVRNDGKISLDLVGEMQAAGLGTDELAANLRSAYSKELEDPRIAVIVREFGGQVFVGGEVGKPAALKYVEGMTALQAIRAAGALTTRA